MVHPGVTAALLLWALVIAAYDWRCRRVPNVLLLALLLPGLAVLMWRGEGLLGASAVPSAVGFALALGLSLPGYAVSWLGAGDVKLAAVLGFAQGWPLVAYSLLAAALLLALITLGALLVLGAARLRALRIPAAVALVGGFAAVQLTQTLAL